MEGLKITGAIIVVAVIGAVQAAFWIAVMIVVFGLAAQILGG
jgi:hypothetical protein